MMMGLAIAHQIREQVVFPINPIQMQPRYNFEFEKKYTQMDYGDKITVI
jgi:hypothetical protein